MCSIGCSLYSRCPLSEVFIDQSCMNEALFVVLKCCYRHLISISNLEWNNKCQRRYYVNHSLHLARKYARIFVCGRYLFQEVNSFPEA